MDMPTRIYGTPSAKYEGAGRDGAVKPTLADPGQSQGSEE